MNHFLFLFLLLFSIQVSANESNNIKTEIFIDTSKKMDIKDVIAANTFTPYSSNKRLGFVDHAIWVKMLLDADTIEADKYFLEYKFSKIESLEYYIYENNRLVSSYKLGSKFPYEERIIDSRKLLIPLSIEDNSRLTVYARLYHLGSIPVNFELLNANELLHSSESRSIIIGVFFGVLFIMVVYSLMLYGVTREKYYLTYVFLLIANFLYQASYAQIGFEYFWSESTHFNLHAGNIFAMLFIGVGVVFITQLLEITPKRLPKIYTIFLIELLFGVLLTLSMLYSSEILDNRELSLWFNALNMYVYMALFVTIMFSSTYLAFKQERTAKLFSISWSIFSATVLIFIASIIGYINYSENYIYLLEFATIIEVSFLSLILGDKLNASSAKAKELSINNKNLEQLVSQRTSELLTQIKMDSITKLQNRYAFFEQFKQSEYNLIMLIDINGFKQLNDFYGNSVGNSILYEFSHFLANYAKLEGLQVFRMSADEFVLLSQSKALFASTEFEILAYEFTGLLSLKRFYIKEIDDEIELEVTIAIAEGSINQADMALVEAKQRHLKVLTYSKETDKKETIALNLDWKRRIKNALMDENIICFYQPIVDANEKVIKYELLMRLRESTNGQVKYISPFFFLEYAVKANQYIELSRYVIGKGIKEFNKEAKLSINLSFLDIDDEGFIEWIREIIHSKNFFNTIVFEILESVDVENFDLIHRVREAFKYDGIEIAIDDFGSGYSNFTHLLELKPNYLKLDGSIIKHIDTDTTAYQLVKSISILAHELGIKTIAEYVHSKEVFEICKEMGINEFQGFYFSEPKMLSEVM